MVTRNVSAHRSLNGVLPGDARDVIDQVTHITTELNETLGEINTSLKTIADTGTFLTSFFRKWLPWGVAFASVAWPVVGKIIAQVPLPQ